MSLRDEAVSGINEIRFAIDGAISTIQTVVNFVKIRLEKIY